MNADQILHILEGNKDELHRLGVIRIGLFGSYRRNDPAPNSDIDFLVALEGKSFNQYMDVKFYLEDLFKTRVDLVLEDAIKPRLRPYILNEVLYAQGY